MRRQLPTKTDWPCICRRTRRWAQLRHGRVIAVMVLDYNGASYDGMGQLVAYRRDGSGVAYMGPGGLQIYYATLVVGVLNLVVCGQLYAALRPQRGKAKQAASALVATGAFAVLWALTEPVFLQWPMHAHADAWPGLVPVLTGVLLPLGFCVFVFIYSRAQLESKRTPALIPRAEADTQPTHTVRDPPAGTPPALLTPLGAGRPGR